MGAVDVDAVCSPSVGCSEVVGGSGSVAIGVACGGMEVRAASRISASVVRGGVGGPVILSAGSGGKEMGVSREEGKSASEAAASRRALAARYACIWITCYTEDRCTAATRAAARLVRPRPHIASPAHRLPAFWYSPI